MRYGGGEVLLQRMEYRCKSPDVAKISIEKVGKIILTPHEVVTLHPLLLAPHQTF